MSKGKAAVLTEKLIRAYAAKGQGDDASQQRTRLGQFAGVVGIACNVALCLGKAAAGALSGSVAIVADALNNLSDASSSLVSLLGFKMASRPADEGHPLGHGRYEYLSALAVAALIVVVGAELVQGSVGKILAPQPVSLTALTAGILVASILVKLWMMRFNNLMARETGSKALQATAQDSRNDAITTGVVLLACVVERLSGLSLDGWAGAAVGVFIVVSGAGLVRDTVDTLLGEAPDPELVERIKRRVACAPGVLGAHDLNVYDYGPGRTYASVHVEMDARRSLTEAHATADRIERAVRDDEGVNLIVHVDPVAMDASDDARLQIWLAATLRQIDPQLKADDVSLARDREGREVLFFNVVCPAHLKEGRDVLLGRICQAVAAEHPDYCCRVAMDDSAVARLV